MDSDCALRYAIDYLNAVALNFWVFWGGLQTIVLHMGTQLLKIGGYRSSDGNFSVHRPLDSISILVSLEFGM